MNAAGIDVSSRKSTVAVLRPFGEVVKLPFDVRHSAEDLATLAAQLKSIDGETRVVMEHTGRYYESVAKVLHEAGLYVYGSAPRGVTDCNLTSQVGAFAAAFLCCTFSLPSTYKFFSCQVRFGA